MDLEAIVEYRRLGASELQVSALSFGAPLVGQTRTARVITAAAAIMIAVFITFVFTGQVNIAEFGIGLAAAMPPDGRPPSPTVKLGTNVQITTPRCPKAAAAAVIRSL